MRRERSAVDAGWIGREPDRADGGWRASYLPASHAGSMKVEDAEDYVLFYAVEEDGTVSTYWRKDRIGFVR